MKNGTAKATIVPSASGVASPGRRHAGEQRQRREHLTRSTAARAPSARPDAAAACAPSFERPIHGLGRAVCTPHVDNELVNLFAPSPPRARKWRERFSLRATEDSPNEAKAPPPKRRLTSPAIPRGQAITADPGFSVSSHPLDCATHGQTGGQCPAGRRLPTAKSRAATSWRIQLRPCDNRD
jgi:hypothetical protein